MNTISSIFQFDFIDLIGLNAPILGHLNLISTKKKSIKKKDLAVHWNDYTSKLNHPSILTKALITDIVNEFWEKQVSKLEDKKHIIVLFRVETVLGTYFTLGKLQRLNRSDKDYYIQYIFDFLGIKSNDYKDVAIAKIVIGYGFRDGAIPSHKIIEGTKTHQNYKHYKLPVTMDPFKYGKNPVVAMNSIYVVAITSLTMAKIIVKDNENNVEIIKSGNIVLSYTDRKIDDNSFERTIGSNHYIYVKDANNEYKLDLYKVNKPARKIQAKKADKKLNDKFVTMDIETYNSPANKMIPYLVSFYDGEVSRSYYLTDFDNHENMILTALNNLMKSKYDGYRVYFHNFAKFDSIFLLNYLDKVGIVSPIINKGKIISASLRFNKKENSKSYVLHFRDSMLLLLAGLAKLAKYFKVEQQKGIFPHRFVSQDNLNYVGPVPAFEFFDKINKKEYLDYCKSFNNDWSLKTESKKYCEADCVSLYQIMLKFIEMMFTLHEINVNNYMTLPSLSFALFRMKLLSKHFIAMLSGQVAKDIRLSYTGGATDMYIPCNKDSELIYGYDINALYPSVMRDYPMPVGKPTYFEGDIRKYDKNAFGFFFCEVITPDNLEHPILQSHVKTKDGLRTVAALGTYEDMLFSEEIDNAIKLGYKIKILWGYTFEKAYIFRDFITDLYNLRVQYPKEHPMNYLHKIVKNSIYGRMGMKDTFCESLLIAKQAYLNFEANNSNRIIDIKSLDNSYLVEVEADDTKSMLDNGSLTHNVNVAISSAIAAYARIVMSQFKNNPELKLFYSDTDSAYTNLNPDQMNELFPKIIHNKALGKLKLETVSSKAIFIAPKVYYLKTIEGEEIFKVKGLDKNVALTEQDFIELLHKDKVITKHQDKWYRSVEAATIAIKNQVYTIQQTDNKRELIYDSNGQLIATKPYIINKEKIISP